MQGFSRTFARGLVAVALLAAVAALGAAGCGGPPIVGVPINESQSPPPWAGDNTAHVARMMTGSFASSRQAEFDSAYFDVRLHMVPIWTDRSDGPWLYVEQAMANAMSQPYRQRVYRLVGHGRGVVESIVFALPGDPLVYAGAYANPARLNALDPSLLLPRMGCSVMLKPDGAGDGAGDGARKFIGSTHGKDCLSELRGAVYATSEITLTYDLIETWDRGYDADGQQVWGAKVRPYRFLRQQPAVEAKP